MDYLEFWAAKYALDLVIAAFAVAPVFVIGVTSWIRKMRCGHDEGVRETMACDAICLKCGKNLGFIGDYRRTRE